MTHVPATTATGRSRLDEIVAVLLLPMCLLRASRRRFRRFLAFSTIDNHTLDDIGLRRTIFTAAPVSDTMGGLRSAMR